MAKIKTSALIVDISGTIGGSTLKRNRGGLFIKNTTTPRRPRTEAQQFNRMMAAELSGRWQALSETQKEMWNRFASTVNPKMSGFNAFLGLNMNILKSRFTRPGYTWSDLGQQFSQTYILSLASLGNGIALAGTYPGGKILRSTDSGATWSDLGQQFSQTYIYSLASLGNGIVLAGTYPGGKILRSTDSGATWADLGQQFSQTYILSLASLGNGIVLAGTNPGGKILRSTDYGATWADLGQQFSQTYIWSLVSLGNGIALAGTNPGGKILRSTDYGATWSDLGQQFSQTYIYSLASLGNGIVIAGTAGGGKILRSTDSGATWSDLGRQFSQTDILSLASLGNGIALAGTNPGGKILRSTDSGATWSDLGQQFSQSRIHSLASLGNGIALAGTYPDGKILRSDINNDPTNPLGLITNPPLTPSTPRSINGFEGQTLSTTQNRIFWTEPSNSDIYVSIYWSVQSGYSHKGKEAWHLAGTVPASDLEIVHTHDLPSGFIIAYKAYSIDLFGRLSPETTVISGHYFGAVTDPGYYGYSAYGFSYYGG